MYIADSRNHRVMRWSQNYTAGGVCIVGCTGVAGNGNDQMNRPRNFKFDSSGNLYVVDQFNHRIQKFLIQSCNSTSGTLDSFHYPHLWIVKKAKEKDLIVELSPRECNFLHTIAFLSMEVLPEIELKKL